MDAWLGKTTTYERLPGAETHCVTLVSIESVTMRKTHFQNTDSYVRSPLTAHHQTALLMLSR